MALSFSLSKSRFISLLLPSSSTFLLSSRSQSSHRHSDLHEIDTSQSPSDPLIQKLEEAVHRIYVRRAAPDWLPFVPCASYFVPPPGSGSQSHGLAQLVDKLATHQESISFSNHNKSSHGWPSSDYFLQGVQPQLMETSRMETTPNTESSEDEEM